MDVVGVAVASIIAQYISAILILRLLLRTRESFGLRIKHLEMNPGIMRRLLQIGIPSAFQYAIFAIANLFVQTSVNSFDHIMVEGNSAAANADPLVYDMMAAFYTACASFIAQNYGASKKERILKSYLISAFMDCTIAASRGLGKTIVPTIIVIMGSCVFRVLWIYTIFAHFRTIDSLYLLYAAS